VTQRPAGLAPPISYLLTYAIIPLLLISCSMPESHSGLPDLIDRQIYLIRGEKVMLDTDLALLYGVTTKRLNEQVKRNRKRFPEDFMFQLTPAEVQELNRSQNATGSQKHRDPRYRPFAFTEDGAVMLASVLNSQIAITAGIQVVRAFVRLRSVLAAHKELAKRLEKLERPPLSISRRSISSLTSIEDPTVTCPPPSAFVIQEQTSKSYLNVQVLPLP
jgi:hypothetical protein